MSDHPGPGGPGWSVYFNVMSRRFILPDIPEAAYQLAFLTPGIRPALAISRNWIREIPN